MRVACSSESLEEVRHLPRYLECPLLLHESTATYPLYSTGIVTRPLSASTAILVALG
jgi:hypothetical protein